MAGAVLRLAVPIFPRPRRLFLRLLKIVPRDGGLGKDQEHGWGIACCIVMCHRLKQSRIATKRFGSQSPIQSFQTQRKTMEAEVFSVANQSGPAELRPTRCDNPGNFEPHGGHSRISSLSMESPISARLNSSEAVGCSIGHMIGNLGRGSMSIRVMVAL